MNPTDERRKVFLSHTSVDKPFVRDLVWQLDILDHQIWLDEAEIAPGDSIVTKVFEGLRASDTVIIVLSKASVESRWVSEELTSAVTRRLVDQDILLVPALIEDCEIPESIKHLCYADFRTDFEYGLSRVLDAIAPMRRRWATLGHLSEHFELISARLTETQDDHERAHVLLKMHDLLESALDVRTEIEARLHRRAFMSRSFFEKIEDLAAAGFDVRSRSWNSLVEVRAMVTHHMRNRKQCYTSWIRSLEDRRGEDSDMKAEVRRLNEVMRELSTPRATHPR